MNFITHFYLEGYHISDRSKYIGGSDIPAIMDCDKYGKSIADVVAHKSGIHKPDDISKLPHVQRGIIAEPAARQMANDILQADFKETFVGHSSKPHLGGNVDGYCEKTFQVLEIKTTGKQAHEDFRKTKTVPRHHNVQLQFYMALILSHYEHDKKLYDEAAETLRGIYVNYRPEDMSFLLTYVEPDIKMHKKMIAGADKIWSFRVSKA